MDLNGRKAVITGGARLVGRALVKAFAAKGARVLIHCGNSEKEARELLTEIGGERAGHSVVVCDLADPVQLQRLLPEMMDDASILVNNASVFCRRTLETETFEEMDHQFAVNFTAPVLLMQGFARYGRRPGAIINLLDQAVCRPDENSFSYGLSKKALADATRAAALQLAPDIRVNGLAPGPVLPPANMPGSRMEKTLRSVPLRRSVALSDLCAGALFLAENESMTGSVLFIDCGQSLCLVPTADPSR